VTIYRIGNVAFDPGACEIHADGHTQHLQPQVRNVLLCLVEHQGEVVPRDTLINEAWDGRRTSDESVTRCISLLRRHFANRGGRHLIETIPKSGYRLHGPVTLEQADKLAVNVGSPSSGYEVGAKAAVNLVMTVAVIALLLSCLIIASDFFSLSP
jgi:DNA-binding winged helix-turn-helix (wHTH) protein